MSSTKTYKFTNISTKTTTVIKTSAGLLHSITINTAGAAANTISVYDDPATSNVPIALIDGTAVAGKTFLFDLNFDNGLTIITATGTQADITVTWE